MYQQPKINYQLVLDKTLQQLTEQQLHPRLLLHACCAPCSSYVLEYLTQYFDITVFYYNPNISPEPEYRHRVEEIQRLIREMCPAVTFLEGNYEPQRFFDMAKGLEQAPERGERCHRCYRLRLTESARRKAPSPLKTVVSITSPRPFPSVPKKTVLCLTASAPRSAKKSVCPICFPTSRNGAVISAPSNSPPNFLSIVRISAAVLSAGTIHPDAPRKDRTSSAVLPLIRSVFIPAIVHF